MDQSEKPHRQQTNPNVQQLVISTSGVGRVLRLPRIKLALPQGRYPRQIRYVTLGYIRESDRGAHVSSRTGSWGMPWYGLAGPSEMPRAIKSYD